MKTIRWREPVLALALSVACGGKVGPLADAGSDASVTDGGAGKVDAGHPDAGPCGGGCLSGQTCVPSTQTCCTPACSGKVCGSDGCGGQCGTCDAGVCDEDIGQCAVDCFAGPDAGPLFAVAVNPGVTASGGVVCDAGNGLAFDQQYAGLASSSSASVSFGGRAVSACLVADLGRYCRVNTQPLFDGGCCQPDPKLYLSMEYLGAQQACGVSGGTQCEVPSLCGSLPGTDLWVFASSAPWNVGQLTDDGACSVNFLTQEQIANFYFSGSTTSPWPANSVRYVIACRPACGADGGELLVDSLWMARQP